jgi:hypothetical protein
MTASLIELSDRLHARERKWGFSSLTVPERDFLAIWELEAEVNNGGFHQYFLNSAGDHAVVAAAALRTIGALKMAAIAEAAIGVFPPPGPSTERFRRQDQLHALGDRGDEAFEALDHRFYEYPDPIGTKLTAFVDAQDLGFARSLPNKPLQRP